MPEVKDKITQAVESDREGSTSKAGSKTSSRSNTPALKDGIISGENLDSKVYPNRGL